MKHQPRPEQKVEPMKDTDKVTEAACKYRRQVSALLGITPMLPCLVQMNVAELRTLEQFLNTPAATHLVVHQSFSIKQFFAACDYAKAAMATEVAIDIKRFMDYAEDTECCPATPRLV